MERKTVLVTGASRGIGAAVALRLARDGYNVAVNYRSSDEQAAAVVSSCLECGVDAYAYKADVSDYVQCEGMVAQVLERFGSLYALVNCAGITKDTLLLRMTPVQFSDVINANLVSVFNMSKLVSTVMFKARSAGRIVSISSVIGIYGNAGQTNYAASKAGIIGFTKSLAKELGGRGITVNAIAPGFIATDMTQAMSETARKNITSSIALGREGQPEDVAGAVSFLLGGDASYITGQVITVDGGMSI